MARCYADQGYFDDPVGVNVHTGSLKVDENVLGEEDDAAPLELVGIVDLRAWNRDDPVR